MSRRAPILDVGLVAAAERRPVPAASRPGEEPVATARRASALDVVRGARARFAHGIPSLSRAFAPAFAAR